MKRYLVVEASELEGPPEVVGFFDDLKDLPRTGAAVAVELATGRVFQSDWASREWVEDDPVAIT